MIHAVRIDLWRGNALSPISLRRHLTGLFALLVPILSAIPSTAGTPPHDPTNATRGWWEAPFKWNTPAIHMCLMRGADDSYAQILWWASGPDGRLWKWNPGDTLSLTANFTNVPTDNSNIFCGGHSVLEDGRLLVTGGTELGDQGLDHTNIFDPQATPPAWQSPRPRAMIENRYYPTNTTLGDGTVLVTSGQRFQELGIWGGERNGLLSTDPRYLGVRGVMLPVVGPPTGTPPVGRTGHTMVFLEHSDVQSIVGYRPLQRFAIFGGIDASGQPRNDLWSLLRDELMDRNWEEINPLPDPVYGLPSPRSDHAALYYPPDSSMVIFGGRDAAGLPLDDVWKYGKTNGGTLPGRWTRMFPTGGDSTLARFGHSMTYDVDRRVAYMFGGTNGAANLNDVWEITLSGSTQSWQKLTTIGTSPSGRFGHAAMWDPASHRQRLLIFGGTNGTTCTNELWELSFKTTPPTWTLRPTTPDPSFGTPTARCFMGSMLDRTFDRWIIFGGDTTPGVAGGELNDMWSARMSYPDPYVNPPWVKDPGTLPGGARAHFGAALDARWVRSSTPEIFYPSIDFWLRVSTAKKWLSLYPNLFLLPSGKVLYAGPDFRTYLLNLASGLWEEPPWSYSGFRGGSGVQYLPGKVLKCGDNGLTSLPTTSVIDLSGNEQTASWREVSQSSLMIPRVEHNLTLLPNGETLVTGGLRIRTNIATAVRQPQIWNPLTETWTDSLLLAPEPGNRDYHSTAILLPDGRILSGGGDLKESPEDTTRFTATIYWPPYLFDAAGNVAVKPLISNAPAEVSYNQDVLIHSPDAGKISRVVLLRPGAVTHAFNHEQRFVPLDFSYVEWTDVLVARTPLQPNVAPVGTYMLFVLNTDGVPSIGRWIKIGNSVSGDRQAEPAAPTPPRLESFPNPFTATTTIRFTLTKAEPLVLIRVVDVAGRLVRQVDAGRQPAGVQEFTWDGQTDAGDPAPAGVYFLRVESASGVLRHKVTLRR